MFVNFKFKDSVSSSFHSFGGGVCAIFFCEVIFWPFHFRSAYFSQPKSTRNVISNEGGQASFPQYRVGKSNYEPIFAKFSDGSCENTTKCNGICFLSACFPKGEIWLVWIARWDFLISCFVFSATTYWCISILVDRGWRKSHSIIISRKCKISTGDRSCWHWRERSF